MRAVPPSWSPDSSKVVYMAGTGKLTVIDAQTGAELQEELLRIWEQSSKTTLFITHSIEEAVYLADRVVVMASQPGRVLTEFVVKLARPRDKQSREFNEIERQVDSCMRGAVRRCGEQALHA